MPVVVMQSGHSGGHTTISGSRTGPNSHLCLAVFTLFFSPPFGLVAVVFSIMSRVASPVDWETARVRGKISMFISVTGIVIMFVGGMIIVLIFFTRDT